MRIATFNIESLDLPVESRTAILRPALDRLQADVVCLQEINGQKTSGQPGRSLIALDQLLEGTRYATYHRAETTSPERSTAASVHNLVTLSRFPILGNKQVWHDLVPPAQVNLQTALSDSEDIVQTRFDRPVLVTDVDAGGHPLTVVNVHLRAPTATSVPGQKLSPFRWRSIAAWAEGYYVSGLKRTGQALELRLLVDALFDHDARARIVVAGDFNAQDHETPLRIVIGAPEDTGNSDLAARALVVLDRAAPPARRFSVLHHGRPQMLDHILASHSLYGQFREISVHNEALGDEAVGYAMGLDSMGSYHAAVVATFDDDHRQS